MPRKSDFFTTCHEIYKWIMTNTQIKLLKVKFKVPESFFLSYSDYSNHVARVHFWLISNESCSQVLTIYFIDFKTNLLSLHFVDVKFRLSEKHTKFEKIFFVVLTNQLIYLVNVKTMRKIFSNYVCFSKSPNFTTVRFSLKHTLIFKNQS